MHGAVQKIKKCLCEERSDEAITHLDFGICGTELKGKRAPNARLREKQIKGGSRKKKIALIQTTNPNRQDLSKELFAY